MQLIQVGRPFFIVSCARSGSTSLARILDEASNGCCVVEPAPNLNRETRDAMDGRLRDRRRVLEETVIPRVREGLRRSNVYGEKNVTYGPFLRDLYDALDCRFVYLTRDGRDVVRSLVDWHNLRFGSVYRECREPGELGAIAARSAAALLAHEDASDYSRPRPGPMDDLFLEWERLSRLEMCAYYWARSNQRYLEELAALPEDSWIRIDYTTPKVEDVECVAEFCGLTGLRRGRISELLAARINSAAERGGQGTPAPHWTRWNGRQRRGFDRMAAGMMERLGYYTTRTTAWKPHGYGKVWREEQKRAEWYGWMYQGRARVHGAFLKWLRQIEGEGEPIESIADIGCGIGVGYAEKFTDRRYIGVDLSTENIEWCRTNRANPRHRYVALDIVAEDLGEKADVVFSSGTVDNTYDVDAFLEAMVRSSKGWIYATCYRGWFPDLREHRYQWNPEHGCFYNNVSPRQARLTLEALGCREIRVEPLETGVREPGRPLLETVIVARVPR